ncbi:MAG: hypothetical protein KKB20_02575 [Proteobacteria bacterium]|nr:hypothetical protein [Pseudomonadota bacterium]
MTSKPALDLTSLETYRRSCLELAQTRLGRFGSIQDVAGAEDDLNAYARLDRLAEPRDVQVLDEDALAPEDMEQARQAVLEGRVFWEHTAAGEATRLKLGTKFLIDVSRDLTVARMARRLGEELEREIGLDEMSRRLDVEPQDLAPLNLGARHMLQHAFDLGRLAEAAGRDPAKVLARQKLLVVLNEKTSDEILRQFRKARFFGFHQRNCLFMVQPAFEGIAIRAGRFVFDPEAPKRLHNHGQLVMQETMDGQIFRLDDSGERQGLAADEFGEVLQDCLDKISYNIEDLDYLTGSIDWQSLALALSLGARGCHMVMEIVANNPERPQKGGLAAYDEVLDRNVMIESFQLKGMPNEEIRFLNKNFNHYTSPHVSWSAVRTRGLPMPIAVKNGCIYFQPVQGDINFLVRTAFVRRKVIKPIRAWKSASTSSEAVNAMHAQDGQPGFLAFVEQTVSDG